MNIIVEASIVLLALYSLVVTVCLLITMNEMRGKLGDVEDAVRVQNMALDELRPRS